MSEVNLRLGPDTNFDVVALLPAGVPMMVLEIDDPAYPRWLHVLLDDGTEGWVSVDFVQILT